MILFDSNTYIWVTLIFFLTLGFSLENRFSEERKGFPFLTFCILTFYHDFIFMNAGYYFDIDNIIISSSWKEIVLIFVSTLFIVKGKYRNIDNTSLSVIFFSLFFVITGVSSSIFISNASLVDAVLIGKKYIYPFLFICALSIIPDTKINIRKSCNLFFSLVVFPSFVFSLWELYNVEELSDLWYYNSFMRAGYDMAHYNHFRDGAVRVNGFFIGTLAYSATAFCSFIIFFILRKERYSYLKMATSLIMLELSQTRTFFIGIAFFILLYCLQKLFYKRKPKLSSVFISILLAFISILVLLPLVTNEYSALGRIVQWQKALEVVINNPFGFGFAGLGETGDNRADSQIIDMIRIYGFFSFVLLLGLIKLVVTYWKKMRLLPYSDQNLVPILAILSYVFVLFFQSLMDVAVFYLLLLLLFKLRLDFERYSV